MTNKKRAAPKTFDRAVAPMPRLEANNSHTAPPDQPAGGPPPALRRPSSDDRALVERLIELIKNL